MRNKKTFISVILIATVMVFAAGCGKQAEPASAERVGTVKEVDTQGSTENGTVSGDISRRSADNENALNGDSSDSGKTSETLSNGTASTPEPTTVPTAVPTVEPTAVPTAVPTVEPTAVPTAVPAVEPTAVPAAVPTAEPTAVPTVAPTAVPTVAPTAVPTAVPTVAPTAVPTVAPTAIPTVTPTAVPTAVPTVEPTVEPAPEPEPEPTPEPEPEPTPEPVHEHDWKEHTAISQTWVSNIVDVDDYETQIVETHLFICYCDYETDDRDDIAQHIEDHVDAGEIKFAGFGIQTTKKKEQVKVGSHKEDQGYYETSTYVDYYYCECGATK